MSKEFMTRAGCLVLAVLAALSTVLLARAGDPDINRTVPDGSMSYHIGREGQTAICQNERKISYVGVMEPKTLTPLKEGGAINGIIIHACLSDEWFEGDFGDAIEHAWNCLNAVNALRTDPLVTKDQEGTDFSSCMVQIPWVKDHGVTWEFRIIIDLKPRAHMLMVASN